MSARVVSSAVFDVAAFAATAPDRAVSSSSLAVTYNPVLSCFLQSGLLRFSDAMVSSRLRLFLRRSRAALPWTLLIVRFIRRATNAAL